MKKTKGFALRKHSTVEAPDHGGTAETAPAGKSVAAASEDPLENLGDLPFSYGSDKIFLIAQDPHWLFTYWDFDIARHPGGPAFLRYGSPAGEIEGELEVSFETRNWYIPVQHAGAQYIVELGYYRDGQWKSIGRSACVQTPPQHLQGEEFDCAVIPLHLSFDKLLTQVETAMKFGEQLMQTVARLQNRDLEWEFPGGAGHFHPIQQAILDAFFGADQIRRLAGDSMNSQEISDWIQKLAEDKLHSADTGGSGSPFPAGGVPGSDFFRFLAISTASEAVASWTGSPPAPEALAAVGRWAAFAFSSFAASPGSSGFADFSGEIASSWNAFAGESGPFLVVAKFPWRPVIRADPRVVFAPGSLEFLAQGSGRERHSRETFELG